MQDMHDTFARTIFAYKDSKKVIVSTDVNFNYLYNNVRRKTSILCTGAAIAFLTKKQAPINDLIDRLYLGWFVRLLHNPLKYTSRILSSFHLLRLFLK